MERKKVIPPQTIEEIRNKTDMVALVSASVKLRKTGKNYVGLCPFHAEKTPSFTVSPDKQLFHCFGCGEGGNAFTFLMKMENLSFAEAVEELGKKAGIIVERGPSQSKGFKEKLCEVMLLAAKFYRETLQSESGAAAQEYLKKRKVAENTKNIFGLGFALSGWESLFGYLIGRGVAPEIIEKAGLALPREGKAGYYDRFRNRLMFPVIDLRGRVIAFSGRSLGDDLPALPALHALQAGGGQESPKYLNSPDTLIYHKGESFFGINLSKDAIKESKTTLLVEGNFDLLSCYQAGLKNVLAPLGTALTQMQAKLLGRLCETVILAYDADSAGGVAAERSAELLKGEGLKVKVADLGSFKDPDELIQKAGTEAFQIIPWLEFKIKRILKKYNLQEIESRSRAVKEVAQVLSQEKDGFVQKEYIKLAGSWLKVDAETLSQEVKRSSFYKKGGGTDSLRRTTEKPKSKISEAEKHLIALACQSPEALKTLQSELTPTDFRYTELQEIAETLFSLENGKIEDLPHYLLQKISSEEAKKILAGILMVEIPSSEKAEKMLVDCIGVIKKEGSKSRTSLLRQKLKEAEESGNTRKVAELLTSLKSEIGSGFSR